MIGGLLVYWQYKPKLDLITLELRAIGEAAQVYTPSGVRRINALPVRLSLISYITAGWNNRTFPQPRTERWKHVR